MQCIVDILHQFNDSFCTDPLRSRTCSNGRAATVPTETGATKIFTIPRWRQPETKWSFFRRFYSDQARPSLQAVVHQVCHHFPDNFVTTSLHVLLLNNRSQKHDDKLMYSVKFRLIRNYILAENWRAARKTEEKIFTNNVLSFCSRIVQLRSLD